jgi:hypothetical protein
LVRHGKTKAQTEVVLRLKAIALIAALVGGVASTASAMTITKPSGLAAAPAAQQIDYHNNKKRYYHKRNQYRAGGRYDRAPSNWHRYHKRPGDWQRRGCIVVGPVWWCP